MFLFFQLQGGDPTGTGRGGESAWKDPFADDFKPHLVHQGRGVLSMANSGPDTNKSQLLVALLYSSELNSIITLRAASNEFPLNN